MPDQVLHSHIILTVGDKQKTERIDTFIANNHKNYSRSRIKTLASGNRLLVNNQPVKASYLVRPNDVISILTPYTANEDKLSPKNIPIEVIFEDEYLIVINKTAGIAVHPGLGDYNNTLVNALNFHINKGKDTSDQIKVVHRLDKHTSGAIVFAKTQQVLEALTEQFTAHSIERTYFAIINGVPFPEKETIDNFIGRHPDNESNIMVAPENSFGKRAITHYEVSEKYGTKTSLVKCRLETGRTHQIRIHMQFIGHSLINDPRYPPKYKSPLSDDELQNCFNIMPHQPLHAQTLSFIHPVNGEKLFFQTDFPNPFKLLQKFLIQLL